MGEMTFDQAITLAHCIAREDNAMQFDHIGGIGPDAYHLVMYSFSTHTWHQFNTVTGWADYKEALSCQHSTRNKRAQTAALNAGLRSIG